MVDCNKLNKHIWSYSHWIMENLKLINKRLLPYAAVTGFVCLLFAINQKMKSKSNVSEYEILLDSAVKYEIECQKLQEELQICNKSINKDQLNRAKNYVLDHVNSFHSLGNVAYLNKEFEQAKKFYLK